MNEMVTIAHEGDAAQVHVIAADAPLDAAASPATMGFKAYNLAHMAALGLNVPPAFVLGTGFCAA
ncbi:MAG: hypothetical protein IH590_05250, partial [Aquamicrobium sp.]|nr:hypothetical protein [Aquamicrobium sp.]